MKSTLTIVGLLATLAACANPNAPSRVPAVEQYGDLVVECGDVACSFSGVARNVGDGVARNVAGTTTFQVGGKPLPVPLLVAPRIPPGASVAFSGSISRVAFIESRFTGISRTTFTWDH